MILDVPIPGIEGWNEVQGDPSVWHVRFMQVPSPAEKLVAGRSADYLGYFFNFGKFTPSDQVHYVRAYTRASEHSILVPGRRKPPSPNRSLQP
jgi:hypothetical protein